LTNDENILDIVNHCHIEFYEGESPINHFCCRNNFSREEDSVVDNEILKLLEMKVIIEVEPDENEYISPIFLVKKKNGEFRMILNLKKLNESIVYHHFKMETFESALKLVRHNCYFASVDLRHAYYSVPIAPEHQVKLRFEKAGRIYQFVCLPNGISCAPRIFTKLMKPVYASLRLLGHTNSGYIDDSLLMGDSFEGCENNVTDTVELMENVGFMIHPDKSVLVPTKKITFLGNNIDSENMTVTLPVEKVHRMVQECEVLYRRSHASIQDVSRVLGLMISSFSAVENGPLYLRQIEKEKILALKVNKGDYGAFMTISDKMKSELRWWIDNLPSQDRKISHGLPDLSITTDASTVGWGAVCQETNVGGRWNDTESGQHINVLELLAVSHAVKSFCADKSDIHVQISSDNTCTVAYINKKGGTKSHVCNEISRNLWIWCIEKKIWLSARHIPGIVNVADFQSRNFNENVEWQLNKVVFSQVVDLFGLPDIDLFASRLNKQIQRYVSWKPDPEAEAVNAFSLDWSRDLMYAFPPFSLIGQTLQKVREDQAEMVLVAPLWTTQNWYPVVMTMLTDFPYIVKVKKDTLTLPQTQKVHPLADHLHLMVCRLSGKSLRNEEFLQRLPTSSWHHGDPLPRNNIRRISISGWHSVIKGKLINFRLM